MTNPLSRRTFLHATSAGTATLLAPTFLSGCAKKDQPLNAPALTASANPTTESALGAWFEVDDGTVRRVMAELTARGADHAELYFQHSLSNQVRLEDGIVSRASSSVDRGVGLRVVIGDQVGYAFTEELTPEAMLGAARTAASIAQGNQVVAPQAFQRRDEGHYYRVEVPWSEVGIDQKLPVIQEAATLAQGLDPAVKRVTASWSDGEDRVLVVDLHGNVYMDRRPMSRLWVNVTAEKGGVTQSNGSNFAGRHGFEWYTTERLKTLAKQAVDRTMVLFDARRPPAGELPVVLAAGASGILLHEAVGHPLEADFNRKGVSIFADKMGQRVAPEFVTIVDDATLPNERGALNVDDEGTEGQRTVLVDKGILTSYLHDRISAKHYGVASTGSGRRQSFRHPILPRMRCTYMESGPHGREEIIKSVKKGIVAETFTNGQVQIGAGDFTFYIKNGWLIEDGKITAPIKDVNIIGNGPDALSKVSMVGNDYALDTGGWTCGKDGQSVPVSQGLPTVKVSKLTVGGENA